MPLNRYQRQYRSQNLASLPSMRTAKEYQSVQNETTTKVRTLPRSCMKNTTVSNIYTAPSYFSNISNSTQL
jgi:hypothetical protein